MRHHGLEIRGSVTLAQEKNNNNYSSIDKSNPWREATTMLSDSGGAVFAMRFVSIGTWGFGGRLDRMGGLSIWSLLSFTIYLHGDRAGGRPTRRPRLAEADLVGEASDNARDKRCLDGRRPGGRGRESMD